MADLVPVKPEPDEGSPTPMDEDIYEDAGDLEFFDPNSHEGSLYLARVPHYVWAAWDTLDEDEEIQVGTVRQWTEVDKAGKSKPRMRLLLRDIPAHADVPKEYELDLNPMSNGTSRSNEITKNTFVFSEQDLPGFKAKNKARAAATAAGIPAHLLRQKEKVEKPGQNQNQNQNHHGHGRRGRQEYFRKAIPKKTMLYGRIKHELNCVPVRNPESDYMMDKQSWDAMQPKRLVEIGDANRSGARILGSNSIAGHEFASDFIKTAPAPPKVKKSETKTARMPENDLLDLIFQAYTKYEYYTLKVLRQNIPQPETYLRQTLEKVADMHRSGRFNTHWQLKPEFRKQGQLGIIAPAIEGADSDADDDDIKMEDVQL